MGDTLWNVFAEEAKRPHGCAGDVCSVCALDARDNATESVLSGATEWANSAALWVRLLPPGSVFTSEDLTDAIGLPAGGKGTNKNNAVGAFMLRLSKQRLVERVGTRASKRVTSHGATIALWRKTGA